MTKTDAFDFLPITFVLNTLDSNFDSQQTNFLNFYYSLSPPAANTKPKTSLSIVKKSLFTGLLTLDKRITAVHSKY